MKGDAISKFYTFTQENINIYMTITLDNKVINSAILQTGINGPAVIAGQFSLAEAQNIVRQLKYGELPITLQKVSESTFS